MLGYVVKTGQGAGDALLAAVVAELTARGVALSGVVQSNYVFDPDRHCHMDLTVLGNGPVVRISQDRGRHARGCRLDPEGLALAVGHVEATLDSGGAALLVVNKFGKAELDGEGFRETIGKALLAGIPVLTTVAPGHLPAFLDYAGDLGFALTSDADAIIAWCLEQAAIPA